MQYNNVRHVDWSLIYEDEHNITRSVTLYDTERAAEVVSNMDPKYLNIKTRSGRPLIISAVITHVYSLRLLYALLVHGLKADARDNKGRNALIVASILGKEAVIDVLQLGVKVGFLEDETDFKEYKRNYTMLSKMRINAMDNYGRIALYYAYKYEHYDCVELLKSLGALDILV